MQPINFTRSAAERISRTVRAFELGDRSSEGPTLDRPWIGAAAVSQPIKICTFTGSWSKGTSHVTTFYNVTTTPNTVTATNVFVDVNSCNTNSTSATAACAIARYDGTWYLIAAECC